MSAVGTSAVWTGAKVRRHMWKLFRCEPRLGTSETAVRARGVPNPVRRGPKNTQQPMVPETRSCEEGADDRASRFHAARSQHAVSLSFLKWPSGDFGLAERAGRCEPILSEQASSVADVEQRDPFQRVSAGNACARNASRCHACVPTRRLQIAPGHTSRTTLQASDASRGSVACAWRSGVVTYRVRLV